VEEDVVAASTLRAFVKRHDRWLVILGGFLLITTFVVKEIVRENMKELKDSLAGAEQTFRVRAEFGSLHRELQVINSRLGSAQTSPSEPVKIPDNDTRVREELEKLKERTRRIEEYMGTIDDLVQKMVLDTDDRKDYDKLQAQERLVVDSLQNIQNGTGVAEVKLPMIANGLNDADKVEKQLSEVMVDVLPVARAEEESRERRYQYVSWVSYGLFLIGSVFSLIGRIVGINGLDGE
jgi:hypothetical protein